MRLRHLAVPFAVAWGMLSTALAPAAAAADLAAHRALYALTLQSARGDVIAADGTMAFEVLDACEGWAVRQRLSMTLTNRDGQDIEMVSDYTTFESKDGLRLRFRMRQTTDQAVTSDVAGDATLERVGGPGVAHYTVPEDTTRPLPEGTLFPMAHTAAILDAAKAGKKFLALPLFDGTGAEGAQDSSIAITSWVGPAESKWPELAKLPSGRVHVAFFDRSSASQQPDYEVGMRYWENGVADDLTMDFGDFVMTGKLKEFTLLHGGC
ncbi:cell envelope integrity EipB family protein [Limobrevibacterium gyesilva]|uniref:Cell envelope integrity EipB family protein n=1 Tax=Limobrevibacterium gyesilva TaxID=2991712 RepID=A0AA41YS01_9PROT|nr:cell envelope integrity EipB family protein [Limobrevibacterium gyesilva]MCW3477268.1 cell envelope integrity EipB family protein [Limobrevibacterium gyesilva]